MRSHVAVVTAIASTAVLAACEPSTDRQAGADPTPSVSVVGDTAFLELPVGRSADNGEISVTFEAVTEDSRCPQDVQCVWAGNASVRLTLEGGGETEVVILGSATEPRETTFAGYTVGLRDLAPYPVSEPPAEPGPYVARIAVVDTRGR